MTTTIPTKSMIAAMTAAHHEDIRALRTTAGPRDTMMTTYQIATLPADGETRAEADMMMTTMTMTDVTVETEIDEEIRAFQRKSLTACLRSSGQWSRKAQSTTPR